MGKLMSTEAQQRDIDFERMARDDYAASRTGDEFETSGRFAL